MKRRKFLSTLAATTGAVLVSGYQNNAGQSQNKQAALSQPGGTVFEPGREIPVLAKTDVLVIGGGPAGVAAALAAGRGPGRTSFWWVSSPLNLKSKRF